MTRLIGHCIGEVKIILRPYVRGDTDQPYLVYAQRFDKVSPTVSDVTGMYQLKKAQKFNYTTRKEERLGSVVPIQCIRTEVQLVPLFGERAHPRYHTWNILARSERFHLNKYRDKESHFMFS